MMTPTEPGADERLVRALHLIGGRLCLDFTNTVDSHDPGAEDDALRSYAALVAWGRHAGALDEDQAEELRAAAARDPDAAAAMLARAIAFRETLYRLIVAAMNGQPPAKGDLARYNEVLAGAMSRARLVPAGDGFTWTWADDVGALDRPLWAVVRSAAELLTSGDLARVRGCAGEGCGWLFLDESRNHSRRWCAMRDCGNRAKARRHYRRHGAGSAGEAATAMGRGDATGAQ